MRAELDEKRAKIETDGAGEHIVRQREDRDAKQG